MKHIIPGALPNTIPMLLAVSVLLAGCSTTSTVPEQNNYSENFSDIDDFYDGQSELVYSNKESPETAEIPVIALSANAIQKDIDHALKMSFKAYLTKPINVKQIQSLS